MWKTEELYENTVQHSFYFNVTTFITFLPQHIFFSASFRILIKRQNEINLLGWKRNLRVKVELQNYLQNNLSETSNFFKLNSSQRASNQMKSMIFKRFAIALKNKAKNLSESQDILQDKFQNIFKPNERFLWFFSSRHPILAKKWLGFVQAIRHHRIWFSPKISLFPKSEYLNPLLSFNLSCAKIKYENRG